jgi:hypothetical protein
MTSAELNDLRRKCEAAYTTYLSCFETLLDASQRGDRPSAEALTMEQDAFNEMMSARRAVLEVLSSTRSE